MTECIFCKIVDGHIPSLKIYEDENAIAFLDINPASPGHALVVPKKHAENIFDIEPLNLRRIIETVKIVAEKMKKDLHTENINIIQNNGKFAGQLVSHIHFHIIPRFPNDQINFHFPRYQLTEDQFVEIQNKMNINAKLMEKRKEPEKSDKE